MKKLYFLAGLLLISLFFGCQNTRYITEAYIKNDIEKHLEGSQSTIKTYSIYQGISKQNKKTSAYIEFTGCKYEGTKKLIVGADKYYVLRNNPKFGQITEPNFVILNMKETLAVLANYNELKEKVIAEQPIPSEEVYHDYTASDELFISFRKAIGTKGTKTIDVWVKGDKYTIKTKKFINKLKKFIDY